MLNHVRNALAAGLLAVGCGEPSAEARLETAAQAELLNQIDISALREQGWSTLPLESDAAVLLEHEATKSKLLIGTSDDWRLVGSGLAFWELGPDSGAILNHEEILSRMHAPQKLQTVKDESLHDLQTNSSLSYYLVDGQPTHLLSTTSSTDERVLMSTPDSGSEVNSFTSDLWTGIRNAVEP